MSKAQNDSTAVLTSAAIKNAVCYKHTVHVGFISTTELLYNNLVIKINGHCRL